MQKTLKRFQEQGRDFLAFRTRALLADEMRLGKTWQALAAAEKVDAKRVVIVCPAVVCSVWTNSVRELLPEWSVHNFTSQEKRLDVRVTVVSYDTARIHQDLLCSQEWDVLIVDESHLCKNPKAQRAKAVLGVGGIAWHTKYLWFLSGTPAVNHAGDLWVPLFVSGKTKMGRGEFIDRYCTTNGRGEPSGTRKLHIHELRDTLSTFALRRTKEQVAPELPKYTVEPWVVPTSDKLLSTIRPAQEDKLTEEAQAGLERLQRELSKIPPDGHAAYLEAHANDRGYAAARRLSAILKVPHVLETIEFEISNGLVDKLVVFGYHRDALQLLFGILKGHGIRTEIVYGGTNPKAREASIKRFNRPTKNNGSQVFIGNILSAGTGIDLSAAHEGIFIEKDWVPGNNAQAMERMGGFKQTKPITIRDAIANNGVDAQVNDTVYRKMTELGWFIT